MIFEIDGQLFTFDEIIAANPDDSELVNILEKMLIGETVGDGLNMATIKRVK